MSRRPGMFYHIKNLQSTKTDIITLLCADKFYHIKNLQSTKTRSRSALRGYKVLSH